MKSDIIGKRRYSKVEQTEIESDDDIQAHFLKNGRQQPGGAIKFGYNFSERIEILEEAARRALRGSGLPDQTTVETGAKSWALITSYVKMRGYPHDSIEGLSAEILLNIRLLRESSKEDQRMEAAFKLGQLRTYAKVYAIESISSRQSAKKPRQRPNIDDEIGESIKRSEGLKGSWRALYSLLDNAREGISAAGDEQYTYNLNGKEKTITFQTFKQKRQKILNG